jgi:peptide/nickel transport system ATP-binding protein
LSEPVLQVQGLKTYFFTQSGVVQALRGVNFEVQKDEIYGLAGETGCGKSVTAFSIMRLISPPGKIVAGQINFQGRDLTQLSEEEMRKVRGAEIGMIFQDPAAYLNPVLKVGEQVAEVLRVSKHYSKAEANARAMAMLEKVRIPGERFHSYPYELSGGMQQRVLIAQALIGGPLLLLADEPTTSLDVTVQAQTLDLIRELQTENHMGVLLIAHNLGIIAENCRRVAIMYAGLVVERGPVEAVLSDPKHPYTKGLLNSVPRLKERKDRLETIPGSVPRMTNVPPGCSYHPRCPYAMEKCKTEDPVETKVGPDHWVACHLFD